MLCPPILRPQGIFGALSVINTFPSERVLVLRERAAGTYSASAYFVAKSSVDLVMQVRPSLQVAQSLMNAAMVLPLPSPPSIRARLRLSNRQCSSKHAAQPVEGCVGRMHACAQLQVHCPVTGAQVRVPSHRCTAQLQVPSYRCPVTGAQLQAHSHRCTANEPSLQAISHHKHFPARHLLR